MKPFARTRFEAHIAYAGWRIEKEYAYFGDEPRTVARRRLRLDDRSVVVEARLAKGAAWFPLYNMPYREAMRMLDTKEETHGSEPHRAP